MVKGTLCPFDSAVAIELGTYRLESLKMKAADELIRGLMQENKAQADALSLSDSLSKVKDLRLDAKESIIASKETSLKKLSFQYDDLFGKYARTQTWWRKNKGWIGLGAGLLMGGVGAAVILH